jgi:hypothetical protein
MSLAAYHVDISSPYIVRITSSASPSFFAEFDDYKYLMIRLG